MLRRASAPAPTPAPNALFAEQFAAAGRWLRRSVRSLFPPIAWRRLLFRGATVWTAAYVGTYALSRSLRPWDAILFMGFCLVVNVSMALTNLIADLVVFSLSALVLLVRLHIVLLQERWTRNNIVPSGE